MSYRKIDEKRNNVKEDYVKSIFYCCIMGYEKIYFVNVNGNDELIKR